MVHLHHHPSHYNPQTNLLPDPNATMRHTSSLCSRPSSQIWNFVLSKKRTKKYLIKNFREKPPLLAYTCASWQIMNRMGMCTWIITIAFVVACQMWRMPKVWIDVFANLMIYCWSFITWRSRSTGWTRIRRRKRKVFQLKRNFLNVFKRERERQESRGNDGPCLHRFIEFMGIKFEFSHLYNHRLFKFWLKGIRNRISEGWISPPFFGCQICPTTRKRV